MKQATYYLDGKQVTLDPGGSSLTAIERAKAFGLKIARVVAIIDRMEGGAEAFAARGYDFSSLLTIRDFGIEPPASM